MNDSEPAATATASPSRSLPADAPLRSRQGLRCLLMVPMGSVAFIVVILSLVVPCCNFETDGLFVQLLLFAALLGLIMVPFCLLEDWATRASRVSWGAPVFWAFLSCLLLAHASQVQIVMSYAWLDGDDLVQAVIASYANYMRLDFHETAFCYLVSTRLYIYLAASAALAMYLRLAKLRQPPSGPGLALQLVHRLEPLLVCSVVALLAFIGGNEPLDDELIPIWTLHSPLLILICGSLAFFGIRASADALMRGWFARRPETA